MQFDLHGKESANKAIKLLPLLQVSIRLCVSVTYYP